MKMWSDDERLNGVFAFLIDFWTRTRTKTTPVTFKEKGLVRWVPSDIYIGTKFTPFCFGTNLKLTFTKTVAKT